MDSHCGISFTFVHSNFPEFGWYLPTSLSIAFCSQDVFEILRVSRTAINTVSAVVKTIWIVFIGHPPEVWYYYRIIPPHTPTNTPCKFFIPCLRSWSTACLVHFLCFAILTTLMLSKNLILKQSFWRLVSGGLTRLLSSIFLS
jgi:hypothetical protein